MDNFFDILPDCLEIAKQSGEIIRSVWDKPRALRHKGTIDLVTETDFAVQAYLREKLLALLPASSFIGEEDDGLSRENSKLCWIVDPVDGTTNFVHRVPQVGISIALFQNDRPVLGIINVPMPGECFYALKGGGAFLNGHPVHVSGAAKLEDSLVGTGFPYDVQPVLPDILRRLAAVLPVTQGLRRIGAASVDLAYVACGRLDAFFEAQLKPWDMAAGWLLVEEAGGCVTSMEGHPIEPGKTLLASNGLIHGDMLKLLQ